MNNVTRYAVIETALCIGSNLMEGEVFMVMATDHDRELAALREDLAALRERHDTVKCQRNDAQQHLAAAEQRNSELVELLRDSYPTMSCYNSALKSDVRDRIDAALKPAEWGASADQPHPTHEEDWAIDHSAGRPVLVYKKCSVIEAEDAYYILDLITKDRQFPEAESIE